MFRLLCFAIIRLLHYLLDTYMCKTIEWDILVISRESVAGNVVGMILIISKFMTHSREITNISHPIVLHMQVSNR
jgi:hypothetical protein